SSDSCRLDCGPSSCGDGKCTRDERCSNGPSDGCAADCGNCPMAVGAEDSLDSVYHSCSVEPGGALWCWGINGQGQLGDGTITRRTSPVQVSALGSSVATVAAGGGPFFSGVGGHTCSLKTNGTLWCWGFNNHGQVGDGTTVDRTTPVQVV